MPYRWAFFHGFLWSVFAFLCIAMVVIYRHVKMKEQKMKRYKYSSQRKQSRRFANQACFYVIIYFFNWIFSMIQWTIQQQTGLVYTPILFLQTIFVPSAGFFNALVYIRPRYLRFRENNPTLSFCQRMTAFLRYMWTGESATFGSSAGVIVGSGVEKQEEFKNSEDKVNFDGCEVDRLGRSDSAKSSASSDSQQPFVGSYLE
jgi:hypothetical protein